MPTFPKDTWKPYAAPCQDASDLQVSLGKGSSMGVVQGGY